MVLAEPSDVEEQESLGHRTYAQSYDWKVTTRTRGSVEPATPYKIAAAEKQAKAVAMKKVGATFQDISDSLDYANRSSAADAVTCAFRDTIPTWRPTRPQIENAANNCSAGS
jgi:hypothetical protein